MGVKRVEDLVAFQLAVEFKLEVYRVVRESEQAMQSHRYREQLFEAACGIEASIDEGFRRFGAAEFARFLKYALGSAAEARRRFLDGVHRGYFTEQHCVQGLELGQRCANAIGKLHASLQPFIKKRGQIEVKGK